MAWIIGGVRRRRGRRSPAPGSLLLLAALVATGTGAAEEPHDGAQGSFGSDTEDIYFGDLPIVLSATRLSQPVSEAPVAVTVIDREMIEDSGARELADVFRLVPGFIVGSKDGSQRIVGYHGMLDAFNRRMQVLVDGRSVYTPSIGGVLWSDLPLAIEDIERIEVVRGPNAATYGPNSFQGVISITTRHSSEDSGNRFKITGGNNGIADSYLRSSGTKGDMDYRVSLKTTADSGFENLHDDKLLKAISFRGDYQATARDSFEFHAGISDGEQETEDSGVLREKGISSLNLQALWRHIVRPGNETRLQIYHNIFRTDDRYFDSTTIGPLTFSGTVDLDRVDHRTDIEFQQILDPTPALNVVWGAEIRRDEVESPGLFGMKGSVSNDLVRVFGTAEYSVFTNTNLSLGVMVEDNDISGRSTSPRLAINHKIAPGHTLRASVSRATRTPSFFESMVSWIIIGDVSPSPPYPTPASLFLYQAPDDLSEEKLEAIDLGYYFTLPGRELSGDIRFFREEYRDLIVDADLPYGTLPATFLGAPSLNVLGGVDAPSFANTIDAVLRGLELQLDWRPTNNDRLRFGYAFTDSALSDPTHAMANSIPEEILNFIWSHRFSKSFRTSVAYYSVDEFEFLGTAEGNRLSEQHRLDIKLTQGFQPNGNEGEISFVIQSALGSYEDYEPVNVFETRAFLTVAMRF